MGAGAVAVAAARDSDGAAAEEVYESFELPAMSALHFRIVLKVKGIEDVHDRRRLFRIEQDGRPAPDSDLRLVAIYARRLLAENDLLGDCRAAPDGCLLLDLPDMERTYFYDGIVFAALDAFNNPNKNPTITGLPPIE